MEEQLCWSVVALAAVICCFLSLALGALHEYSLARFDELLESDAGRMERLKALLDREETLALAARSLRGLSIIGGMVALTSGLIVQAEGEIGGQLSGWDWAFVGAEGMLLGAGVFVAVGYIVPQGVGERRAEPVILRLLPVLAGLIQVTRPLTWFLGGLSTVILRVLNVSEPDEKEEARDEILSAALAGAGEGVIDETTKDVIENLMEFRDAEVTEVMTPRIDMITVEADADLDAMLAVALEHEKSRFPVTAGNQDTIVGVLLIKDLLRAVQDRSIEPQSLFRKPFFVPETKRVADLLKEFRANKVHMAIVADEYGGTAGLVTIEDLIEEIIGEIEDEHDKEDLPLRKISDSLLDVDAKLHIDELNEEYGTKIPEDEDVETLGGFIALRLGRIPQEGDVVELNGTSFEVTEADERRVARVLVKLAAASPA